MVRKRWGLRKGPAVEAAHRHRILTGYVDMGEVSLLVVTTFLVNGAGLSQENMDIMRGIN